MFVKSRSLARELRLLLPVVPVLVFAAVAGASAARSPTSGLGIVLAAASACLLLSGLRLGNLFLASLFMILVGYAFLDKAFAYIGVYPVYVSEAVLFLAVLTVIVERRRFRLTALHSLLVGFMVLGTLRTTPYLEQYGIEALRDGVIWGYALFALALALSLNPAHFKWITRVYAWAIPVFLVWLFFASIIARLLPDQLPTLPGSNVSILTLKTGDMGVQLGGIGAFILAGFTARRLAHRSTEVAIWLLWLVNVGIQGASGRASLLASGMAFTAALFFVPARRTISSIAMAVILAGAVAAVAPTIDVGSSRSLSFDQITKNVASIVSDTGAQELEGTKVWRELWWNKIIDYTFGGTYFWTGKGFGVNLATDDGIEVESDALRSPHNSHLTVLARMGVPGLALWALLQAVFGANLLWAYVRARKHDAIYWCRVDVWLFAYWLALIANASFDVFFEGPQGGIWFWSVFGMGLAAIHIQRSLFDDADRAADSASVRLRRFTRGEPGSASA